MIDIRVKDIIVGVNGGLCYVEGEQPQFSPIDEDLFAQGVFSDVVYDYFNTNWGIDYEEDDSVAEWMRDNSEILWFDIRKDDNGDYYYVVGDNSGIVYYEQVDCIVAIYDDYEVRFNEDSEYYYVQFLDKSGEYYKENWTLEEAILDMEKRLESE